MARFELVEFPDPRLRRTARPVVDFDADLALLVDHLVDRVLRTAALGLSAPQVDDLRAVCVVASDADEPPLVFINPVLVARSAYGIVQESCLSLPGITGSVVRCTRVRVRAQDVDGQPFEQDLEGMPAVCLQHEMDHLVGKLFVDKLPFYRRWALRRREREARARSAA